MADKLERIAYVKGYHDGHRKFEAEFETLLEVSENRLKEIDKLKEEIQSMHEDAAGEDI